MTEDEILEAAAAIKADRAKAKKREYAQRPEVKTKQREYQREHYQRPEVKAKQREYAQRPEVKAKKREYQREYYQRPEAKAKQREYYQARLLSDSQGISLDEAREQLRAVPA